MKAAPAYTSYTT